MEKYLVLGAIAIGSAIALPRYLDRQLEQREATQEPAAQQVAVSEPSREKKGFNPLDGRKARIAMDSRGHFLVEARMNGRTADVLVDTGATYVAINESTARRLGIKLKDSDFKYKINTANGVTYAAGTTIDEIMIGRVVVRDVKATVSRDESLSTTLLGMSFLKKLKKFEISNGELVLIQ